MSYSSTVMIERHYVPMGLYYSMYGYYSNPYAPIATYTPPHTRLATYTSPLPATQHSTPAQPVEPNSVSYTAPYSRSFFGTRPTIYDFVLNIDNIRSSDESIRPDVLNSNSSIQVSDDESQCVICYDNITSGSIVRILNRCNHRFHVNCIDRWVSSDPRCPFCRSPIIDRRTDDNENNDENNNETTEL